jgi:pilus assembly protein Flp/PilA
VALRLRVNAVKASGQLARITCITGARRARRNDMTLTKLKNGVNRFITNKEGASAIEYVIIVALVAVVVAVAMPGVGTAITGVITKIVNTLTPLS